jgi:hypothetical protein
MTRYFAQNTPRAGLEHMMMSVPGFQKRGGGMMILSRFCYKPEDVDCRTACITAADPVKSAPVRISRSG